MGRKIDTESLVGATEIAGRLGVKVVTVHQWRSRYEDFPSPVAELHQGLVYSWSDIERWTTRYGLPDRRYQRRS